MSNLRIIGLVIGIFGLILTFRIYRGRRWRRLNFVLSGIFSVFIIAVCLNPDLLNRVAGMLALQQQERGRILTLLIFSNIGLWFLLINNRTKLDEHRHQFDLLIRNFGHEEVKHVLEQEIQDKQIVVILPAYNEGKNLNELLKRMPETIDDKKVGVLLVDDGSDDDTYSVAKQAGVLAVRNRINRGQGAASRLGYDILVKHNIPFGVTMDSDGQHQQEDIEKLIRPVLEDKCDLVIGSRMLGRKEESAFLRSFGVIFFTKIINALTGMKLTDCSSGFKAFNISKMEKLELREDQFQSAEVIIEAAKKGLRIGEVPITITKRKHGQSKKGKDWSYGLNFAKTILKAWWR
jgi:hypothetical protein